MLVLSVKEDLPKSIATSILNEIYYHYTIYCVQFASCNTMSWIVIQLLFSDGTPCNHPLIKFMYCLLQGHY